MVLERVFANLVEWVVRPSVGSAWRRHIVALGRKISSLTWFIPIIEQYVSRRLEPLGGSSVTPDRVKLLVLNCERFMPDLKELSRHCDIELVSLPSNVQHLVNAIFLSGIGDITNSDPDAYLRAENVRIQEARQGLNAFLQRLLPCLARKNHIDAIITCAFYYGQDREWESAAPKAGIPFFCLHKENMKDEPVHQSTIVRYQARHFQFTGTRLFVYNNHEASLIEQAGVCESTRIETVGALRLDSLFSDIQRGLYQNPGRQVVLFSFHHYVGLLQPTQSNGFFSDDPHEGFVEYFALVHAAIAELACEYSDIRFHIKPKWGGHWIERIKDSIQRKTKIDPESLPNLTISLDVTAQELIKNSAVVIGINSTTLLEAKLARRPVIIPLFAEAAGKYFRDHVYFKKYFETFRVAHSPEEMKYAIIAQLNATEPTLPSISNEMVKDFLGYFDGHVSNRIVEKMKDDIVLARQRSR
ncbi:MAG: hypothetical protein NPIRA02_16250 [Nitrospirales bacterium]|nr:MAG: hypothetical protein NPIRA02_16250 [Nitrospirales bacterium]